METGLYNRLDRKKLKISFANGLLDARGDMRPLTRVHWDNTTPKCKQELTRGGALTGSGPFPNGSVAGTMPEVKRDQSSPKKKSCAYENHHLE